MIENIAYTISLVASAILKTPFILEVDKSIVCNVPYVEVPWISFSLI